MDVLANLLQKCLGIHVGDTKPSMSRHVSAVGPRFRLLKLGLSMLQGRVMPSRGLSKAVLRERVYANAIDYFTEPPQPPTQRHQALRDDIITLARFLNHLHTDIKHFKESGIVDGEWRCREVMCATVKM